MSSLNPDLNEQSILDLPLPINLANPLLANTLTFRLNTNRTTRTKNRHFFPQDSINTLDPELAIGFLRAFFTAEFNTERVIQINFFAINTPSSANIIIPITEFINQNFINCLPVIHIDNVIDDTLLDHLIEFKSFFQISYQLQNQDFINLQQTKRVKNPITQCLEKITAQGLPWVYRPTITKHNVLNMPLMVEFAYQHGACGIVFKLHNQWRDSLSDISLQPDQNLYLKYLQLAVKLAATYHIEISLNEMLRLQNNGNYQPMPSLVLLPDGYIATTKKYNTSRENGALNAIIGQYTLENGIQFFQKNIDLMINNIKANLALHCHACECYTYCRGRNVNMQSFKERIVDNKDEYHCDITRGIYRFLK